MEEGLKKLYSGDFNYMNQEQVKGEPEVTIITLVKAGERKRYTLKVRNLYKDNEQVLEHEIIEEHMPQFISDRMKEAKEWKDKKKYG